MYDYKIRQLVNGDYFILEIPKGGESESFLNDFINAISLLNPKLVKKGSGITPNDFMEYHYTSIMGEFCISIDIWQIAFVNAKEELLLMIDSRLLQSPLFNKLN